MAIRADFSVSLRRKVLEYKAPSHRFKTAPFNSDLLQSHVASSLAIEKKAQSQMEDCYYENELCLLFII